LQQYKQGRGYFTISNAPLAEKFALIALAHRDEILNRTRAVVATNLKLVEEFFTRHPAELGWIRPRGGMTVFPWLRDTSDAREFCRAVADRGVLLAPGDCFDLPEHFRLGFGVSTSGFAEALDRITEVLRTRRSKPLVAAR
jgi:aspartate/methionine/tyrosine aminotransferase